MSRPVSAKSWQRAVYRPKHDKSKFAAQLRANQSPPERILWSHLRKVDWRGMRWIRQKIVCGYIADFALSRLRIIVEVDGRQHLTRDAQIYDKHRDNVLIAAGWTVLRYPAREVFARPSMVVQSIVQHVTEKIKTVSGLIDAKTKTKSKAKPR